MKTSNIRNLLCNLSVVALLVASFNTVHVSTEVVFGLFIAGGMIGIVVNDYRTPRSLAVRLPVTATKPVTQRRRVSALVAA